jgi:hypothetical protein
MVTTYEMNENEMGYRVSKSSTLSIVKEQRADGSYRFTRLRCALMAFEKRYQFKILSKFNYNSLRGIPTQVNNVNLINSN